MQREKLSKTKGIMMKFNPALPLNLECFYSLEVTVVLMFPISSQDHFVYANISASVDIFSENMEELDKYLICISEKFPYNVRCFNTFYLEILFFIHNQPHHDR